MDLFCGLPPAPRAQPSSDADASTSSGASLFVVSKVVKATGGRTGCFLFSGRFVVPPPSHAATPPPAEHGTPAVSGEQTEENPPFAGFFDGLDEEQIDLAEYEGQELSLYMSYEEASPKIKRCGASVASVSPWRAILRDEQDVMVYYLRGLPNRLQLDASLRLACWGDAIAVRFPTTEDAQAFASKLDRVEVEHCCLANSPQMALLAASDPEQSKAQEGTPSVPACSTGPAASSACPLSPIRDCGVATGNKRKAEEPTVLLTPFIKPRITSLITPTCSSDFGAK